MSLTPATKISSTFAQPRTDLGAYEFQGTTCRTDMDGSGDLTLNDFIAFRNHYTAGEPAADFDGSGTLTLADFVAFRNAYAAGCR